jgi:acetyl esterase/lipase
MRKLVDGTLVVFCLFLIAACASTGKPQEALRYTLRRDLSYGPHERNVVDISIPEGPVEGVILFIHGGMWIIGGKENRPNFLDVFRDRFAVASMNHRYIDETVHIKDLEEDVIAAVAFIRDFCLENKGEPGKLIIMGHSSGAHLAMLYAYKNHAAGPMPLAFCVDMAGPADMADIAFLYNFKKLRMEKLFYSMAEKAAAYHIVDGDITSEGYSEAGKQVLALISPISYTTAEVPPTIIVHDVADNIVPYSNSAVLNSVFNLYGVDHYFMATYSGIGHALGARYVNGKGARYDKTLEAWIIRVMNEYMDRYCRSPEPEENSSPQLD